MEIFVLHSKVLPLEVVLGLRAMSQKYPEHLAHGTTNSYLSFSHQPLVWLERYLIVVRYIYWPRNSDRLGSGGTRCRCCRCPLSWGQVEGDLRFLRYES